jgi:1,5-anhydro-D-fructose reductase (1,5-anhydro-D-mannitol-forming)
MIRVAILGFWHVHAADYAAEALAHPGVDIVAAWDDHTTRGRARAAELDVTFHDDLGDLLARPDVDGVIVTTATNAHPDVITAAAKAGKHVFTEKVLALTPADARRIVETVNASNVKLTVSLPRLADGYTLAIRDVLASGRLGDVTEVRCRLAHDGAVGDGWLPAQFFDPVEAGGGALVDLGCHPLYLTRLFLGGMPETVSAVYGHVTSRAVEDNAVVTMHYASGAVAIAETGFVTPRSPFTIEINGTTGSLLYGGAQPRLFVHDTNSSRDDDWTELPIPPAAPSPLEQWAGHIADGSTATENIALALELTTLVDAANTAARTGREQTLGPRHD